MVNGNVKFSFLFTGSLWFLLALKSVNAWTTPKDKHCKAESPQDDGYLSHCDGLIKCPDTCPDCHLSCKYCGMAFCPKCNKVGSVCQDPRFVGGDGIMFYFHGHKDADFCMVSDSGLHINAHFIGKRTAGRPRDFTWVQAIGILFHTHKLYIGAKRVSKWKPETDQFVIYSDGSAIQLPQGAGNKWTSQDVTLIRIHDSNSLNLEITGLLNSTITIVPVTKEESRVHKYEITDSDCFAHLELNLDFLKLTNSVSGVLGQTYAPNFENPVKTGVPMPIMGGEDRYEASSIFTPDCAVAQFRGMHHSSIGEVAYPMKRQAGVVCGSDGDSGSGFACRG